MEPTPNQYPQDNRPDQNPYQPPCARAPRYRPRTVPTTYRPKTHVPPPPATKPTKTTPLTPPKPTLTSAHLDAIAAASELGMRPPTAKQFALEVPALTDTGLILRHILNRRIQPK